MNVLRTMLTDPLPWAVQRIRAAGGPLPLYGSEDWNALGDRDPRRWAAVIVAAECWRDHRSPGRIAVELRQALKDEDAAVVARLKAAAVDVAEAKDWAREAAQPTYAELACRRAS